MYLVSGTDAILMWLAVKRPAHSLRSIELMAELKQE
jgi:hypothetical protein